MAKRNFRPRVTEPQIRPGVIGVGVELELYDDVPGITGHSIVIYLQEGTSVRQAEHLRDLLADIGQDVVGPQEMDVVDEE